MTDLFPEIDEKMKEWNRALRVRRIVRRAYERFRGRRPWRWLPMDNRFTRPILARAFQFLGFPRKEVRELRDG